MNKFVFRSVGQGIFYTGLIGDFQFVYDCGAMSSLSSATKRISSTDEPSLFREIQQFSSESSRKELDFLAISHFDADHVNGLPELGRIFKFKRVFLPYLDSFFSASKAFFVALLLNGVDVASATILFSFYRQATEFKGEDLRPEDDRETKFYMVKEGAIYNQRSWVFHFYCDSHIVTQPIIDSLNLQIDALLTSLGYAKLTDAVQNDKFIKEVKKIFKATVRKNLNETSMILFHHPSNSRLCPFIHPCEFECCLPKCFPSTLLTGDINFRKTTALSMQINQDILASGHPLFVCSLPHHGSKDNFDSLLANINIGTSQLIMCYGITNVQPKKFPCYYTIAQISKMGNSLRYVNEFQNYKYVSY